MDYLPVIWDWTKKIAGVILSVCVCLYLIRCISDGKVLSFIQFEFFLNKLLIVIFS